MENVKKASALFRRQCLFLLFHALFFFRLALPGWDFVPLPIWAALTLLLAILSTVSCVLIRSVFRLVSPFFALSRSLPLIAVISLCAVLPGMNALALFALYKDLIVHLTFPRGIPAEVIAIICLLIRCIWSSFHLFQDKIGTAEITKLMQILVQSGNSLLKRHFPVGAFVKTT